MEGSRSRSNSQVENNNTKVDTVQALVAKHKAKAQQKEYEKTEKKKLVESTYEEVKATEV